MTDQDRMRAWRDLCQSLDDVPPGSPQYLDEGHQRRLQGLFEAAYDSTLPAAHADGIQRQIDQLMEKVPPGTPGYSNPAFQAQLSGLFQRLYGDEPVTGQPR